MPESPLDAEVVDAAPVIPLQRAPASRPTFFLDETRRLRLFWRLLLFAIGFIVVQILGGLLTLGAAVVFWMMRAGGGLNSPQALEDFAEWLSHSNLTMLVIQAFAVAPLTLGLVLLLRRFVDRRPIVTIGFSLARSWATSVPVGLVLGVAIIAFAALVVWLAGGFRVGPGRDFLWVAALIVPLVLAAFEEEILVRGYLLRNFADLGRPVRGLVFTSVVFWILHGVNPSAWSTPWVGANLFLAGWLLGLAYLISDNLWFPTALHFGWNFAQGPILGINVSGIETPSLIKLMPTDMLHVRPKDLSKLEPFDAPVAWLSGGQFGLEGSAVCALIQLVVTLLLAYWYFVIAPRKRRDDTDPAPDKVVEAPAT